MDWQLLERRMSLKIANVGAGIGGLAAALAMAQAGLTVELYERAPALLDQGAGITMAPNATRVLFHLGLEPALLTTAAAPPSTDIGTIARVSSLSASITGAAGSGLDIRICVSIVGICKRPWLGK
jgi:2-polyprenyl-6-methoxyphenol hydroxylase-like FAD-dependent oxidoreductase